MNLIDIGMLQYWSIQSERDCNFIHEITATHKNTLILWMTGSNDYHIETKFFDEWNDFKIIIYVKGTWPELKGS